MAVFEQQQANQVLEHQVEERTSALRTVNGELDTLAYRTAHDIRGPVARLLGLCQVALMEQGDPEEAHELLELIQQEAFEMDIMLHRFLEVNNIKHQKEPDKYIRVSDMVDDLLRELDHLEGHAAIDFQKNIEPGLQVVTNETIFRILLKNLLENAIRFYRKSGSGPNYLRISGWLDSQGQMQLKIADNGIGIDPEVEPYIFNMFYRGTHASTGLGLGLYAARLAASRLGASLTYEGNNPEETEFRIVL
ncbi:MAG: HAMP domain-containing sensor histidine kinase [Bacteroidota bacterium]